MNRNFFSRIQNPMTIIALFVGLTEVGLGIAFPSVPEDIRRTFMSFLIIFPSLCAIGFFLVLFFRPQNFYSPGDFRTDESYLATFEKANLGLINRIAPTLVENQISPKLPIEKESLQQLIGGLQRETCFYFLRVANKPFSIVEHLEALEKEVDVSSITAWKDQIDAKRFGKDTAEIMSITLDAFGPKMHALGYLTGILSNFDGTLFAAEMQKEKVTLRITGEALGFIGQHLAKLEEVSVSNNSSKGASRKS